MNESGQHLRFLRELTWSQILVVIVVLISCRLLVLVVRWIVRRAAESAPSHRRLLILRTAPIARLLIWIGAIVVIVPLLIEPTFENIVALAATLGLAIAFAIKDYVRCLIAGVVTIYAARSLS
jgi:small conductance mechanosensitive channel